MHLYARRSAESTLYTIAAMGYIKLKEPFLQLFLSHSSAQPSLSIRRFHLFFPLTPLLHSLFPSWVGPYNITTCAGASPQLC